MRRSRSKPPAPESVPAGTAKTQAIRRRRFLRLIAAGGAAVVAGAVPAAAPAAPAPKAPRPRREKPERPSAVERELAKQRQALADQLKVIRAFPLPPGSELAVTFRPIRARREGR